VGEKDKLARFEALVLPHLDAGYNLARWLLRHDQDAEDAVQEAYLRAYKFFDGFRDDNARAWLLMIVRNTCYTWLEQKRTRDVTVRESRDDEEGIDCDAADALYADASALDPELELLRQADAQLLERALDGLPVEFREVMVLRELEGLSYKQISVVTRVPVGTVMSRLARARKRMQKLLMHYVKEGLV